MTAYWIARSRINDPIEYKKYTDRIPAIIAKYGGRCSHVVGVSRSWRGPTNFVGSS